MAANSAIKTPIARSLPRAISAGVRDGAALEGKSLPASVVEVISSGIVRVKFEVETGALTFPEIIVPVFMSEYVRLPIQIGCKGMVIPADAYLSGVTGMGSTPDLTQPGNLGALAFMPLGNADWAAVDGNTLVLYGVTSAVLMDSAGGSSSVTVNSTGATLAKGSNSVAVTASGVAINGTLTINGDAYTAHRHTGVTTGAGISGGVSP